MKNLTNALIIIASISIVLAVISRAMFQPILDVHSRSMAGFAVLLLLLSIALSVKK
jgi:hypothetical protein